MNVRIRERSPLRLKVRSKYYDLATQVIEASAAGKSVYVTVSTIDPPWQTAVGALRKHLRRFRGWAASQQVLRERSHGGGVYELWLEPRVDWKIKEMDNVHAVCDA